jgi:hypothetical protein
MAACKQAAFFVTAGFERFFCSARGQLARSSKRCDMSNKRATNAFTVWRAAPSFDSAVL